MRGRKPACGLEIGEARLAVTTGLATVVSCGRARRISSASASSSHDPIGR
jgi:hypothetical protein